MVLAVFLPLVMLGAVLALGRYEDLVFSPPKPRRGRGRWPSRLLGRRGVPGGTGEASSPAALAADGTVTANDESVGDGRRQPCRAARIGPGGRLVQVRTLVGRPPARSTPLPAGRAWGAGSRSTSQDHDSNTG